MCHLSLFLLSARIREIFPDRRAQYFLANSTLPSPHIDEDTFLQDEEAYIGPFDEQHGDYLEPSNTGDHTAVQNDFVNQLEWDEDLEAPDPNSLRPVQPPVSASVPVMKQMAKRMNERKRAVRPQPAIPSSLNLQWKPQLQETTPLLAHKVSFSSDVPPRRMSMSAKKNQLDTNSPHLAAQRRLSNVSLARSTKPTRSIKSMGQSTFGQTVRFFYVQWSRISNSMEVLFSSSIP